MTYAVIIHGKAVAIKRSENADLHAFRSIQLCRNQLLSAVNMIMKVLIVAALVIIGISIANAQATEECQQAVTAVGSCVVSTASYS